MADKMGEPGVWSSSSIGSGILGGLSNLVDAPSPNADSSGTPEGRKTSCSLYSSPARGTPTGCEDGDGMGLWLSEEVGDSVCERLGGLLSSLLSVWPMTAMLDLQVGGKHIYSKQHLQCVQKEDHGTEYNQLYGLTTPVVNGAGPARDRSLRHTPCIFGRPDPKDKRRIRSKISRERRELQSGWVSKR